MRLTAVQIAVTSVLVICFVSCNDEECSGTGLYACNNTNSATNPGSFEDISVGGTIGFEGCDDSCAHSKDQVCDEPDICAPGTDCTDCSGQTSSNANVFMSDNNDGNSESQCRRFCDRTSSCATAMEPFDYDECISSCPGIPPVFVDCVVQSGCDSLQACLDNLL